MYSGLYWRLHSVCCLYVTAGLQTEGTMDRLVPCPNCMSHQTDSDSLRQVKMFPVVECATLIFKSLSVVVCDVCPVECGSIPLTRLVPDLLLLDVTTLNHMDLFREVWFHDNYNCLVIDCQTMQWDVKSISNVMQCQWQRVPCKWTVIREWRDGLVVNMLCS